MDLEKKEPKQFQFTYTDEQESQKSIPLQEGGIVFILGANGTGKSALTLNVYIQNQGNAKRISAHRQTWFPSNTLEYTPTNKIQTEANIDSQDAQVTSRWRDDFHTHRSKITIFNLINAQNVRARNIAGAVDEKQMELAHKLSAQEAPLKTLNHLLQLANLPIKITVEADETILASKNDCNPYSIAELSDGERNAILIAGDVLTAKAGTLFIIDEPERHLHRSIISPLLSALFQKRSDCAFIIATHDVNLPLDNPEASILLIRDCVWKSNVICGWDADLVSAKDGIDFHIKQDILGSRRSLLFVEGTTDSLDQHIYQVLFPSVSVIPQGSCAEVEKVVLGIGEVETLHWVKAFGLIDADDRQKADTDKLHAKNIFTLPCYSVESLYYSNEMIQHIAERQAEVTGEKSEDLTNKAQQEAIKAIGIHKDRLCARLCERKIRSEVKLPNWKDIQNNTTLKFSIDVKAKIEEEKKRFDSYIQSKDMNSLVGRYPVRETPALDKIATALGFQNREKYQGAVIKLLIDDEAILEKTKKSLGNLSNAIENRSTTTP